MAARCPPLGVFPATLEEPSIELLGGAEFVSPGGAILGAADQVGGIVFPRGLAVAEVLEQLKTLLDVAVVVLRPSPAG